MRNVVVARTTKSNSWVFEFRARNHRRKWMEIKEEFQLRPHELPKYFQTLFDYMYHGVYEAGTKPIDRLTNPEKFRVRLPDRLEEFLEQISCRRHGSVYETFGSDPDVVAALGNRDAHFVHGIDFQANAFGRFAADLLTQVAFDINQIVGGLKPNKRVRTALGLSVHIPWFDEPRNDAIEIPELQRGVLNINSWLDPRT